MAIIRWEPFNELTALRRQMEHLLESYCRLEGGRVCADRWSPPVDLAETEDEVLVKMDIPGIDEKDLSVTLTGNQLEISGRRQPETKIPGRKYHRVERTWGAFGRVIVLPANVDAECIEAAYERGVLTVRMPKKSPGGAREIPIRTS